MKHFKSMEYYFKHAISLPIYVDIKKNTLVKIVKTIKEYFKKNK